MRKALLAKIHIAKKQLGLDDETYRQALKREVNKDSCANMTPDELETVLKAFKKQGFKTRLNSNKKRLSPKSETLPLNEINKIRAIFIQMGKDGFLRDASEPALSGFVKRMTKVDSVQWLKYKDAVKVLEALKLWHKREMCKAMNKEDLRKKAYDTVCKAFNDHNEAHNE